MRRRVQGSTQQTSIPLGGNHVLDRLYPFHECVRPVSATSSDAVSSPALTRDGCGAVSAASISVNGPVASPARVRVRSATAANGATVTLSVFPTTLLARPDVLEATSSSAVVSTRAITYQ